MSRSPLVVVLCVALCGCAILHPYSISPEATKQERRECRKHCAPDRYRGARSESEANENEGACWLSCVYQADPWYVEEADRRNMPAAELLAHGFCRPLDGNGRIIIDQARGEVVLVRAGSGGRS